MKELVSGDFITYLINIILLEYVYDLGDLVLTHWFCFIDLNYVKIAYGSFYLIRCYSNENLLK